MELVQAIRIENRQCQKPSACAHTSLLLLVAHRSRRSFQLWATLAWGQKGSRKSIFLTPIQVSHVPQLWLVQNQAQAAMTHPWLMSFKGGIELFWNNWKAASISSTGRKPMLVSQSWAKQLKSLKSSMPSPLPTIRLYTGNAREKHGSQPWFTRKKQRNVAHNRT